MMGWPFLHPDFLRWTVDMYFQKKRGAPPWAPSCRPHSAQSQLARARAVGLVTGPEPRTPRTHSQWVVGPGHTPEGTTGRGSESARPRTPRTQTRGAPPRAPPCRPHSSQSKLARARAVGLVTFPHACISRTHSQWVVGPAARQRGRVVGDGRAPYPRRPTSRQGAPPPGALMPPPQRAKSARKSALCGVGDRSTRPHPPHPQPVGSGPLPHTSKDERSGVGERPTPDATHPGKRRPPGAPWCRHHSAQSQLARARAVGLMTGPHARTHPAGSMQPEAR